MVNKESPEACPKADADIHAGQKGCHGCAATHRRRVGDGKGIQHGIDGAIAKAVADPSKPQQPGLRRQRNQQKGRSAKEAGNPQSPAYSHTLHGATAEHARQRHGNGIHSKIDADFYRGESFVQGKGRQKGG